MIRRLLRNLGILNPLLVKAHFASLFSQETEPVPCVFVKITNASRYPVTVTHVDFILGKDTVYILGWNLPRTLQASQQMEVYVTLKDLRPDGRKVLKQCRVTNSLGEQTWSSPNRKVPASGHVA
jgi:hypothetical protein